MSGHDESRDRIETSHGSVTFIGGRPSIEYAMETPWPAGVLAPDVLTGGELVEVANADYRGPAVKFAGAVLAGGRAKDVVITADGRRPGLRGLIDAVEARRAEATARLAAEDARRAEEYREKAAAAEARWRESLSPDYVVIDHAREADVAPGMIVPMEYRHAGRELDAGDVHGARYVHHHAYLWGHPVACAIHRDDLARLIAEADAREASRDAGPVAIAGGPQADESAAVAAKAEEARVAGRPVVLRSRAVPREREDSSLDLVTTWVRPDGSTYDDSRPAH